jgi:cytochrome c556
MVQHGDLRQPRQTGCASQPAQEQALTRWTANPAEFSKNLQRIEHEAQIVAALAEIISREGYEFTDDESYLKFANLLGQQALEVRQAANNQQYDRARSATGRIGQTCINCHEGFRS